MKKIMFNDKYGLTQAVLEGRKTMTRRIVPKCKELDILRIWEHNEGAIATGYEGNTHSFRFDYCPDKKRRISIDHLNLIPSYKVGEVVAVAQKYKDTWGNPDFLFGDKPGWSNKMFVAADLMPHQIRITNIRVERLQDISEEDCSREGIYKKTLCPPGDIDYFYHSEPRSKWEVYPSAREAFAGLIDKVSGKGTWVSNPWVFVYEFELAR